MNPKHRPSPEDVASRIDRMLQDMARFRTPEFLDVGITMAQAKVLHVVVGGEIDMSELVHALGVSLSTVSGLVEKLVDQGYVTRRDDPADRRQVVVSPTAAGTALLERFRDLSAPRRVSSSSASSRAISRPSTGASRRFTGRRSRPDRHGRVAIRRRHTARKDPS